MHCSVHCPGPIPCAGKLLAAVRDFGAPCGHPGLEALGWPMDRPYFNAGLLLLDIRVGAQACSCCAPLDISRAGGRGWPRP